VQIERLAGLEDLLSKLEVSNSEKDVALRGEVQRNLEQLRDWAGKSGVTADERAKARKAINDRKVKSAASPKARP
jgi:hypothetical protein